MKEASLGSIRSLGISRRVFIKLAAAAGVLAGCSPIPRRIAALTDAPADTPIPTATPTSIPAVTPSPIDTPASTGTPTVTRIPSMQVRRPEIIRCYPDTPSKVVYTHHGGVWNGERLVTGALEQMLDASITELTGLSDATAAWAALFAPNERIAIKVNAIGGHFGLVYTHLPFAMAVAERLQAIGVPADQIFVFDRYTSELSKAGYPINQDGMGVRCYGTSESGVFLRASSNAAEHYTAGWRIMDADVKLSDILLSCHALINLPILTGGGQLGGEGAAGISFAMKNHYGTFNCPTDFHGERFERGIVDLNALPPIKQRTRLIIGDVLTANTYRHFGRYIMGGRAILASFDPVAHDTVGAQISARAFAAEHLDPTVITARTNQWLGRGTELGLGTNDLGNIDIAEISLG